MNTFARFLPWFVVVVAGLYLVTAMVPPASPKEQMHLEEFASLPILDNGRVKPIDTLARTSLMIISGRQTFKDEKDETQPAIKWLLDVMTSGPIFRYANEAKKAHFTLAGEMHKVFRIDNDQVRDMLGLPRREGYRYAIDEFAGKMSKLEQEADRAEKQDSKRRTLYEARVLDLYHHLQVYLKLAYWPQTLYAVPPLSPDQDWQRLQEISKGEATNPAAGSFATLVLSYAQGDVKGFNQELDAYRKQLDKPLADQVEKSKLEAFFNHFAPFYQCAVLYVFVFVVAIVACLGLIIRFSHPDNDWKWPESLLRAAFWLAILTLSVHTWALLTRMYLQGRPPVTNLYSSAIFIGWGCVVLCLVLEWVYHLGVGTLLAAVCGALTMLIAHHLAGSGDTLEMLQAVLDTNFWLATHVTCVTLGYTATFVAGFIGIAYILLGVLTPFMVKDVSKILGQMLYAIVCFATLLSFTGTVLGGIWADVSWGRFWGWDPKENGALLIVIWNALILHARWGGMVKERGMAVLAVVGNMVTGWSWFGTNQLGVGLHAYGFNNTLATGLVIFWGCMVAVIVMGVLPMKWWQSYEALSRPAPRLPLPEDIRPEAAPGGKQAGKRRRRQGETGYMPGPA
jgi:ABC-type transport system involved in cytochrome c biogenesis permease subunit